MPSSAHSRLIERIRDVNRVPDDPKERESWIRAERHLALLRENQSEDELIIYGAHRHTHVHSVVVKSDRVSPVDQEDLLEWSGNPYSLSASYESGGPEDSIWIDRSNGWFTETLNGAIQLVFARHFEGLKASDASYCEIHQEYAHLLDVHWRPERRAYCQFDQNGDFEDVVSITSRRDSEDLTLVSFKREPLEQYLAVSDSVLVRMFGFGLFVPEELCQDSGSSQEPRVLREGEDFFYRQVIHPTPESATHGIQIIRPSKPKSQILLSMQEKWSVSEKGPYVAFKALDWRNKRVTEISTDPIATTSYAQARGNSLPFETSAAFFNPEVLHKYRADEEKYSLEGGMISCRSVWELRTFDVNEEGQVHTYICYLSDLPHSEQLYWLSFNEEPKAGISQRAFETDFLAEFPSVIHPSEEVLHIVSGWIESGVTWWKSGEDSQHERIGTPHSTSRKEWAEAFSSLSKLVIEGFQVKAIRASLSSMGIPFDKDERSLKLLERLLVALGKLEAGERLSGLRESHLIRSKVSAHSGGRGAVELANEALKEHDTYAAHFESVCKTVAEELKLIQEALA